MLGFCIAGCYQYADDTFYYKLDVAVLLNFYFIVVFFFNF